MFSVRKDHLLVLVVGVVCSLGVATADAALIIDFRLDVGGGKAGTVTAVGNTFLVDVYGMITGGSGGSTDGLQTLTASFLSSNAGVILGDISGATRVSPFDSGGSKVGVQAKLDADTDWDWGSTVSLSSTGWFVGRAALQNGPEFKVGTFTFTVTSLDAAAGSINLFPTLRDNTTAYIWREAGTAKNKGNGTVLAGDPIVLNWAGSGAPNMANSITSISKNVLLNASLATVDTTVTITNSGNLAGTPGLSNGGSATHTALSPSGAIASGGGTATTVVSIASTGTYGTVNGSVLATTTGDTSSGNDTTSISVNVGNATASDTGAFVSGNRLSAAVAANGSYANLASKVTAGSGRLATSEAIILAGTAGGTARDVGMNWRTRTGNEASGGVLPGLPWSRGLLSDVVDVTGTGGDTYVLQMKYDPSQIVLTYSGDKEQWLIDHDRLFLAYFDGSNWQNAGSGLNLGAYTSQMTVGNWGVNAATDTVWAVVNHNSGFAVMPEPGTVALLALGGALALLRRRRAHQAV